MRISVFAASSSMIKDIYFEAASTLGKIIASSGHEVIFGGGGIGLMGALSDGALSEGGKVTGVIPEFMIKNGWGHSRITRMIITEDMNSRKKKIFEISDAVIALPGGAGTLEELTEAITLKQLGKFKGPVIILNTDNFYDPLLCCLDHLIAGNFMREEHRGIWKVVKYPEEAMEAIKKYKGWMDNPVKIARI